jgi:hypothetical protein
VNKPIEDALAFDGLSEAERVTGKSYKIDPATETLGVLLHIANNAKKKALLSQSGDTHFGLSFSGHIEVFKGMGFSVVAEQSIPGTIDKWVMLWRSGILIFCESYRGDKSLNIGKAYFNCKGDRPMGCSNGFIEEIDGVPVWDADIDVREGFKAKLARIEAGSEILPKWLKPPFLWLLNYAEKNFESENVKRINAERISMLPEGVRSAMNCEVAP